MSVVGSHITVGHASVGRDTVENDAMVAWLDELDFLGVHPDEEKLAELHRRCPNPGHPEAVKVSAMISPSTFASF